MVDSSQPPTRAKGLRVAVQGCCHGELDKIYETMRYLEARDGRKIDLLLCCGDFQAVRNLDDLECMACPPKYRHLATFYKYYSGETAAPYPTLFIGGNHEASNHLWELYHGGWAAPNIYYLGHAGVVSFGGLRIGGLSGIYKPAHYGMGHFERAPYTESTMRSAYHVRAMDVHRLLRLSAPLDVFLSHDWPAGVAHHGDARALFRKKPFLRREVEDGSLGSPPAAQILAALRPSYWFSAHLHTKFAALVPHPGRAATRFLALDKCLPGRAFLQVLDFPEAGGPLEFGYDAEWLAVLRATHSQTCLQHRAPPPPPPRPASPQEVEAVRRVLAGRGGAAIPRNFVPTARAHDPGAGAQQRGHMPRSSPRNPQTVALLDMLGLQYNLDVQQRQPAAAVVTAAEPPAELVGPAEPNPEEIDIGSDDDVDEGAAGGGPHDGNPEGIDIGCNDNNVGDGPPNGSNPEEIGLDDAGDDVDEVEGGAHPALAAIFAGAG